MKNLKILGARKVTWSGSHVSMHSY